MKTNDFIHCESFICNDVRNECYLVPNINIDPEKISIIMISEAAPADINDYYYSPGQALFKQTTIQAFQDAGSTATSIEDILDLGVYLTTAIKCGKTGYAINLATITACSFLLEQELALFPKVREFLLMGDAAIKAINIVAKRAGQPRVIPPGSTYKLRNNEYFFRGRRTFPSYLQAGPSFFIEKSKRRMIADDIRKALETIRQY